MRRRAVVLTPRLPWPLDDGGRLGLWQTVWSAAQEFQTTLLSLVPPGTETSPLPTPIVDLGVEVMRVPHHAPSRIRSAIEGSLGRWPYTLARYQNRALTDLLPSILAERDPAFVFVNHLHLAPYVDRFAGVPMVLREHNVEHRWMARYAKERGSTLDGLYARFQARRLRMAEADLCSRAALVLAIQEEEATDLRRLAPSARIALLPMAVDFQRYKEPSPINPPVILLVGAMGWPPNASGAERFAIEGWPRVRAAFPMARLRVAGKDPPSSLRQSGGKNGVEVLGYVDSIRDEFVGASVLVVPLWAGAGIRVKIVEALAARLPVVSTTLGAEGLDLIPGEHFLAGETPEVLADQLVCLLRTTEMRKRLARNGYEFALERWSLPAVARMQNRLCSEIVTSPSR